MEKMIKKPSETARTYTAPRQMKCAMPGCGVMVNTPSLYCSKEHRELAIIIKGEK